MFGTFFVVARVFGGAYTMVAHLISMCSSGLNKGFAFVTYKSMGDVARVLQSEVTIDGRPLSIKLASQQDQGAAMKRASFCSCLLPGLYWICVFASDSTGLRSVCISSGFLRM